MILNHLYKKMKNQQLLNLFIRYFNVFPIYLQINNSFYTEQIKEQDFDSGSGSSCDGNSSADEDLFVDDLEEKEALSNKMTAL